jgi:hypothetical protein
MMKLSGFDFHFLTETEKCQREDKKRTKPAYPIEEKPGWGGQF